MFVSKKMFAIFGLFLVAALAIWWLNRPHIDEVGEASNDIPVIIRTNGGMLEIETIKHRRTFNLTKTATVLGFEVPFCKEMASYTVDASISYRVRLAKRWVGDYKKGVLSLVVPPPEPFLPVPFDTSRLRATLDDCALMPSMNAKDELLRSISGKLEQDAKSSRYLKLARGDDGKATIREFAQKWLLSQKQYDLPSEIKIEVSYSDE